HPLRLLREVGIVPLVLDSPAVFFPALGTETVLKQTTPSLGTHRAVDFQTTRRLIPSDDLFGLLAELLVHQNGHLPAQEELLQIAYKAGEFLTLLVHPYIQRRQHNYG